VIANSDAIEVAIMLPFQISMSPMGCRSAVRSVATFRSMTDGQVACPLRVWKASSNGRCLNFTAACVREARAMAPSVPLSFRIWVQERIAAP
jgi:hypothetical protein